MEFNVYTWGEVNSLATVLSVLKSIAENGDVQLFILTMVIITGAITFIRAFISGKDAFSTFVFFFFGTSAFLLLFTKVYYKVNIINVRDPTASPAVVQDVPAPVALTAHYFSAFEKVLMDVISSSFQTPSGINYNNAGYNYGANLFSVLPKANLSDPYLRRTLNSFIYDCFYEDILQGNKDFNTLFNTSNIWGYLNPIANPYTVIYDVSSPSGYPIRCSDSYNYLTTQFDSIAPGQLSNLLSALTFIPGGGTSLIPSAFTDFLGQATNNSAVEVFKNTVTAKYMYDALEYASTDSLVSNDIHPYAEQIAKNNVFKNWEIGGSNARELLPAVKALIQLALFALFPFLMMMIFTPMRAMYIKMYIVLFFWLALWDPLYAILTYVSHLRLENLLTGVSYGQGYTMSTMGPIFEQAMAHMAIWNYFALAIPMLALALAKGSEHALVGLASSITSGVAVGGSSIGSKIATPQGAGEVLGGAKEVGRFGSSAAFNEAADHRLINAMKSYGTNASHRGVGSIDSYATINASKQQELRNLSENTMYNDKTSLDIGTAQAVRQQVASGKIFDGIKQYGGDIGKYVDDLAKSGAIKDVAQARAFLNVIDKEFGNGDGYLSKDEITEYQKFAKNKALLDTGTDKSKMEEIMSKFKDEGLSEEGALMSAAVFVGKGEAAKKLLHSVKNQADLSALMKLSDYDFNKAKNLWEQASGLKYSKEFGNVEELANRGRQLLGDKAKGKSDFEVISMMGSMFGENSAQKEMYDNAKWDAAAKELAGAENKEDFIKKLTKIASLEGTLDASAKKGLQMAAEKVGLDNLKQMVRDKTAGNFFKDIVEGLKNKNVIKALGDGDYKKGVDKFTDIATKQGYSDVKKAEAFYNELVNHYKGKGMSSLDALAQASADLGKFHAFNDEGRITALRHFGGELRTAFESGEVSKASEALGRFKQAGGDMDELAKYMSEKGKMDVSHAKAMFEFSNFLEKIGKPLGLTERDANDIYQAIKEGGGFIHSLSAMNKVGAILGVSYLADKLGGKLKDYFKGAEDIQRIKSGKLTPKLAEAEKMFMNSAKDAVMDAMDGEIRDIEKSLKSGNLSELQRQDLLERRSNLLAQRNEIAGLNMNNAEDRAKLFNDIQSGEITKNFRPEKRASLDIRERVNNRMDNTVKALSNSVDHLRNNVMDKLEDAPEHLKTKFQDLANKVIENPKDAQAAKELGEFIDNKLIGGGYLSRKDLSDAMLKTAAQVEKLSPEAASIFKEVSGTGVKGVMLRGGVRFAFALARLSNPFGWGFATADIVTGLVTGKSLTERAIEPLLSYRTGEDANKHVAGLSSNMDVSYGSGAGEKFLMQVALGGKSMFERKGADFGYGQFDEMPADFLAHYADAFYSYLNEHQSEFTSKDGTIDLNKARNSFDKILKNQDAPEHDKYVGYFFSDKKELVHKDKTESGKSEIIDYFRGNSY